MIFKFGIDTNGYIHIGHLYLLLIIKRFLKPKDKIIILLGDFTSKIGDPSLKKGKRKKNIIDKNIIIKDIKLNLYKIFKKNNIIFFKNSFWFKRLRLVDFLNISEKINFKNLFLRREIKSRLKKNKEIKISEFLYPLFQGFDNIIIQPDYEFGGIDQLLNFMISKKIQKKYKKKKTRYLFFDLLPGIFSNNNKMSKSKCNCIFLNEKTEDIFWKILKIDDKKIIIYEKFFYKYVKKKKINFKHKLNLYLKKKILFFFYICKILKKKNIKIALRNFFKKKFIKYFISKGTNLIDFLVLKNIFKTRKSVKRLVDQNSLKINGKTVKSKIFTFKKKGKYFVSLGKKVNLLLIC